MTPRMPRVERRRIGVMRYLARDALIRPGAGDAHDLAPFLGFPCHERAEVLAERSAGLGAELAEALHHFGRGEDLLDSRDHLGLCYSRHFREHNQAKP